jgi:hypothetical protein
MMSDDHDYHLTHIEVRDRWHGPKLSGRLELLPERVETETEHVNLAKASDLQDTEVNIEKDSNKGKYNG